MVRKKLETVLFVRLTKEDKKRIEKVMKTRNFRNLSEFVRVSIMQVVNETA